MPFGVSSPIVDVFARDQVPRDVRLLAARGQVGAEGVDRLVLLAMMAEDEDGDVAALAAATIDGLPESAVRDFIGRDGVPAQLRAWYEARSGAPVAVASPDPIEPPIDQSRGGAAGLCPAGGDDVESDDVTEPTEAEVAAMAAEALPDDEEEAHQLLTSLPVPKKLKLATLGRREQRAILIRDPNRLVSTAVLASPKLTETEVENFSRMQNVSDEVLRIIGTSRVWTKNYTVVSSLVRNPRTPTAISLPLLGRLAERDVKGLTVNRNVPESVRLAARKQLDVLQSRKS
ncbi:MAG: hypothetical protein IT182_08615 [Acidobacteria bacterium]|nr:hypothetical protein [Acidobacteriota bacterium]